MVVFRDQVKQLAEQYLVFCRSRGLAQRTIDTYHLALDGLSRYMGASTTLTRDTLRAYVAHLLDEGYARATISIRLRAVRTFCSWLVEESLVEQSPFDGVQIPRLPKTMPRALSSTDIAKLVSTSSRNATSWTGIRNHAMVLTFLDTGIRLSELSNLDLSDLHPEEWSLRIRHGKGDKERRVFMGRKLHRAMRQWINARGVTVAEDALFVSRYGERLDNRNVQRILARLGHKAGITDVRVSPHKLRHTFACEYIRNGGDAFSLQNLLGHSTVAVTAIYVRMAGEGLREAHAKASPGDRLLSG